MPPPDEGTRSEYLAFLTGAFVVLQAIKRALPGFDRRDIWKYAIEAATELYPPFDPLPNPVKAPGDGVRSDGVVMSED
jgi:hypothetical protein